MLVRQVVNVLELIEFFAARKRPATLSEVAQHFDWPRSSTFNLLGTLAARGYLYEPKARGGFYPTPRWLDVAREAMGLEPVPEEVRRALQDVAATTGETAAIVVPAGLNAVFLEVIESTKPVRYSAQVGKIVPIHATATGRALLSLLSPGERSALLRKVRFERYTASTLMSVEAVEQEIERSAKRGWFESKAEFTADLGGVAVPLPVPNRQIALLVGGPSFRVKPRYKEIAATIHAAVRKHLGGATAPSAPPRGVSPRRRA
jgi:IclR family acetate operon transcriptional repressor